MKTLLTIIALQDLFSCLGVLKRSLYMKQRWFSRYMVVYFIKMNQKFQMVKPHFPLFWYPMFHSGSVQIWQSVKFEHRSNLAKCQIFVHKLGKVPNLRVLIRQGEKIARTN